MALKFRFHVDALTELDAAVVWYEQQRPGTGARLHLCVYGTLSRIAEMPDLFPRISGNLRKAKIQGFPFLIIYKLVAEEIFIHSVFHEKRDPRLWKTRMNTQ